jgi:predicted permease
MRIRLKVAALQTLLAQRPRSQNDWAMKLGLSKGHLSDLVAGKHQYPSGRTRERMLEVLAVEFETLFEIEPGEAVPDHQIQRALHDHYLLDKEIGHGGMGTVYLARDIRLGRTVAVKVVSAEVVSGVGSQALLKEVIQTNRLQHPNILPVLDAGEVNGSPYYVMPYVRGGSLRALLRRDGRVPIGRTLALVGGVAAALDHAHTLGVLHCDVKPDNVLLTDDHSYLIDFGIGRVVRAEVWSGESRAEFDSGAGTPAYVSPEQARGDGDLDRRTDVYSLACMMFEMLSGRPPFEGANTLQTVAKRFTEAPPLLHVAAPMYPRQLSAVIQWGMAVDRHDRIESAGAFVRECRLAVAAAGSAVGLPAARQLSRGTLAARISERLDGAVNAIRLAVRTVARAPGLTFAVALTLGLGVGINAVMFNLLDRLFLQPPPGIVSPDQVRRVYITSTFRNRQVTKQSLAYPELDDVRATRSLASAAAFFRTRLSLGRGAAASEAQVLMATHDLFGLLGARAALGRFYDATDDVPGVGGTVVLSDAFWRSHYGQSTDVLGKTLLIGSGSYTVIGVAPPGFNGIDIESVDLFLPLRNAAHESIGGPWETSRGIHWLRVVTRLAPGVAAVTADADATLSLRTREPKSQPTDPKASVLTAPLLAARGPLASQDAKISLWLGGVAMILLIIACANVINLLLTRLTLREGEFAVRAALGAGRVRIAGQLLLESVILALFATTVGLAIVAWGGKLLGNLLLPGVVNPVALSAWRVPLFTLGIALGAGILAGALPAWWNSRLDVAGALKIGRGGSASRHSRLRTGLLIFQTALSVLLLIGAGLFVRSMNRARHLDAGIDLEHLIVATVNLATLGIDSAQATVVQQSAIERIAALPGVAGAVGSNELFFSNNWADDLSIPGFDTIPVAKSGGPYINIVGSNYFATVGTAIRAGRGFNDGDRLGSPPVTVIGATMARLIWPGESPLGRCMRIGGPDKPCSEIVGVAEDAPRESLLDRENSQYYVPAAQYRPSAPFETLFIRATGDPERMLNAVRGEITTISEALPFVDVRLLRSLTSRETRAWQLGATLFSMFGGLAMVVAALGLYSVLAFTVASRTREFGIRAALGATVTDMSTMVLKSGLRMILAGLLIGFALALAAGRWVAPLLYQTAPDDPLVFGTVGVLLLVVGSCACLIPARRATRVMPMEALRSE